MDHIDNKGKNQNSLPGIQITPYIRYGSLPLNTKIVRKSKGKTSQGKAKEDIVHLYTDRKFYSPPDPYMKQYWKCGWCNKFEGVVERPEAIDHLNHCSFYQENLAHIQNLKKKKKKIKTTEETTTVNEETTTTITTKTKTNSTIESTQSITPAQDSLKEKSKNLESTTDITATTTKEKVYFCKQCNQEIVITTPADILRHRKQCQKS